MQAYEQSGRSYCDAKLLGAAWGMTPAQGKYEIGMKYLGGFPENIEPVLAQSRQAGHRCTYDDTGLDLDDAYRLASVWGVNVTAAKARAARAYTRGNNSEVLSALGG